MECNTFEDLLLHFHHKIELIQKLIPLARICAQSNHHYSHDYNHFSKMILSSNDGCSIGSTQKMPDLVALSQMTLEMKQMVVEMKLMLRNQKESLLAQKEQSLKQLNTIEAHYHHLMKNIPTFLQHNHCNDGMS